MEARRCKRIDGTLLLNNISLTPKLQTGPKHSARFVVERLQDNDGIEQNRRSTLLVFASPVVFVLLAAVVYHENFANTAR